MSIARVGVVSRVLSLICSGGRSSIRYSAPYLPGISVAESLPCLIWRLTVLVDIPSALAAWAMVSPCLDIAMVKGIPKMPNGQGWGSQSTLVQGVGDQEWH